MKRFMTRHTYLMLIVTMGMFLLAGCGAGSGNGAKVTALSTLGKAATGVPVNTKISATFSEAMDSLTLTTTTFTVKIKSGATAVSGAVTYSGVTAVFAPASDLLFSTEYVATITTGAKDASGNALAADYVWSFTTGVAPDTTPPTVSVTSPTTAAVDVPVDRKITVGFSEGMDPASITASSFSIKETGSGNNVPGVVTPVGTSATFVPTSALAYNTNYTVTITTAVKDLSANALANNFLFTFTTGIAPDTTLPTVTFTSPINGATAVAQNAKINAAFSESMDPLTMTVSNFKLTTPGLIPFTVNSVAGTVSYLGSTATFIPSSNLSTATVYTATMTTGAKDLSGNALVSDYVWTFTTGTNPDTTAPTVTGTINANGATNVAINTTVGATFSESMDPLTISNANLTLKETVSGVAVAGTVSYSGVSATLIPSSVLAYSKQYTVTVKGGISGVQDLAGNPMATDFTINWTTGAAPDTIAPTVTGTIHANGATNVAVNTSVGATFSEGMDPLTITNVNFTLKETISGTAVAGTVSYSGVSATLIPSSNLSYSKQYTVTVKGGASGVKDLAGNPMATDFTISWTTGAAPDTIAPTVTGAIPANAATNVAANTSVAATFSEGMDPLTITNIVFTVKETVSGTAVAGTVSYSGVSATFIPSSVLAYSRQYTATVKGGVSGAKDLAGNALVSDYVWSFTTGAALDATPPTVIGTINADGATNVAVNTNVGATFSEGMNPLTITNVIFTLKETVSGNAVAGLTSYSGVNSVFTPLANLAYSTRYTATVKGGVSGAKDLAGNALVSDYVWSWTTGALPDIIVPTVTLVSPADLLTGVATSTPVTATFSEAMDPLSISSATFTLQASGPPLGATLGATVVYDSLNKIATLTPSSNLADNTKYTATVTSGAKDLAGNSLSTNKVWSFTTAVALPLNPTPPTAGETSRFVILASQKVTTTIGSAISYGDIGIIDQARSYYEGFVVGASPGLFTVLTNGVSYAHDDMPPYVIPAPYASTIAFINQVRTDLGIAYSFLAADPNPSAPTQVCPTQLGGLTLTRGVYKTASNVLVTAGPLHLDAQNDPNSVFIFTTDGTLTIGAPSGGIVLENGALAKNVYWRVSGKTVIEAGRAAFGNIFSWQQVNLLTNASITGRLFSVTEQVTLDANAVTKAQ